jgi:hypothetical protein
MATVQVIEVKRTCFACPSQWEGKTKDGQVVYARYRFGELTVGMGKDLDDAVSKSSGALLVDVEVGGEFDGDMTFAVLKNLTAEKIEWPRREN